MRSRAPGQVDVGDTIHVVRTGEEPGIRRVVTGGQRQARQPGARNRNDVNAVAVVVERGFVHQSRADGVGGVDNAAIGGIVESVPYGWHVGAAPLADRIALRDLLGDKVSEDRKPAREIMIDAKDFFPQIRRSSSTAEEFVIRGWRRENPSAYQRRGVAVNHARRNRVAGELRALHDTSGSYTTRAVGEENAWGDLCGGRNRDVGSAEISPSGRRVCGRIWNQLPARDAALDQRAPFHVVKEEGPLLIRVVKVAKRNRAAHVESVHIEPQLSNRVIGTVRIVRRVEEIARVEGVVAVELPRGGVILAGP